VRVVVVAPVVVEVELILVVDVLLFGPVVLVEAEVDGCDETPKRLS
jgi:hypothetical protein